MAISIICHSQSLHSFRRETEQTSAIENKIFFITWEDDAIHSDCKTFDYPVLNLFLSSCYCDTLSSSVLTCTGRSFAFWWGSDDSLLLISCVTFRVFHGSSLFRSVFVLVYLWGDVWLCLRKHTAGCSNMSSSCCSDQVSIVRDHFVFPVETPLFCHSAITASTVLLTSQGLLISLHRKSHAFNSTKSDHRGLL